MAKQITVQCPSEAATLIIDALKWFVASHYPYAADECSAAAREALLDVIARFEGELSDGGCSRYSSRIRAFLTEALKGYTGVREHEDGQSYAHRLALLIRVCRGESDGADYARSEALDRRPPAV